MNTRHEGPKTSTVASGPDPPSAFVTTHWSVVQRAGSQDTTRARNALAQLCEWYWRPLYAFVRRQGKSREDAEDLVQGFFAHFLSRNSLEGVNPDQGRFRAYLLASLKHFMANEWDRAHRQKRGGRAMHLSLDWHDAETRYQLEAVEQMSPDQLFDREWALTLLERVLSRLGGEFERSGKREHFEILKGYLKVERTQIRYADVARATGMEQGTARVAVHRLRKRYREMVREEIAQTLLSPDQVEDEMQALFAALSG